MKKFKNKEEADAFILNTAKWIAEKNGWIFKDIDIVERWIDFGCPTDESDVLCAAEMEAVLGEYIM